MFNYKFVRRKYLKISINHFWATTLCICTVCCCLISCASKDSEVENLVPSIQHNVEVAGSLINSGDYVHALDTLIAACHDIDVTSGVPDTLVMRTYFLMGKVHSIFDDSEGAISFYTKGLTRKSPDSNPEVVMKLYGNLYHAYATNGDFEAARHANDSLLNVDIKPDGMKHFLYNFNSADLASRQGDYSRSIEFYRKAINNIDGKTVTQKMLVYPYSELAETYRKMGLNDSAYVYLKKFEKAAEADGEPYVKVSALRELLLWSTRNRQPEMASDYLEKYFAFTDSLVNIRAFLKTKENMHRYEEETSHHIISNMSESISHGNKVIAHLVVILMFVGLIAAFVLWRSTMIRKKNRLLFAKNEELTKIESLYRELLLERKSSSTDNSDKTVSEPERNISQEFFSRIMLVMEDEKPYLDPEFSLQALAELVESNTKYVSQAINEHAGRNFRNFINEFRIKEAERRLLDKENYGNYTIQGIAESVGIKSKSTFVAAFKKVTGLTPSVYIKLSKDQEKKV